MTLIKVNDYNGLVGKICNEQFEVQVLSNGRKYLVNWNPLIKPKRTPYRIVREYTQKNKALVTPIKDPYIIYNLKENYECSLNPIAFEENAPLIDFDSLNRQFSKQ